MLFFLSDNVAILAIQDLLVQGLDTLLIIFSLNSDLVLLDLGFAFGIYHKDNFINKNVKDIKLSIDIS
jgi:hypothetical protein